MKTYSMTNLQIVKTAFPKSEIENVRAQIKKLIEKHEAEMYENMSVSLPSLLDGCTAPKRHFDTWTNKVISS